MQGFFVGAGFNAFGIASGGGAGMALAEWVAKGDPPMDLWPVDIRRFGRTISTSTGCARARSRPTASTTPWPGRSRSIERPAAARLAALRAAEGAGRRVRREARLGAAELVRRRPGEKAKDVYSYGRQNWFAAVGARAPGGARAGGALRPDLLRQIPADRPRRRGGAFLDLRQRCRQAAGQPHLHADAELARRHRMRPHRRAPRRGPLLHRHRHRLRHARFRLDQPQHPGRPRRPARRHHLAQRRLLADGAARPRRACLGHPRRRLESGLPVRHLPDDLPCRRAGAGAARDLCRRARLGAAHPGRVRGERLRAR